METTQQTARPVSAVQTRLDPNIHGLVAIECGLTAVFKPRSVALVGATERTGSVGNTVMLNLIESNSAGGFKYAIYPVNPTRESVCGYPCFKRISDIQKPVDLVVVVTPAKTVLSLTEECANAGVRAMAIISAGFKEIGDFETEEALANMAKKHNIRIIGPNCLGVMSPNWGLNATFAATTALNGGVAFLSQSGAMLTAVLDWSLRENIGFSAFVSVGNMCDVSWGDMIYDLGEDPNTRAILMYMETVGDVRKFMSAAKVVSCRKPIVALKSGKSEEAAAAAASHTGSLAGSHDAFLAAMRRAGVLVVDTIGDLFACGLFLDKAPSPRGPRLMIITNAGGPGVLATDATSQWGGKIATLEPEIIEELNGILPAAWSHANPIDVLGDASAEVYKKTLVTALKSEQCDGILVILSPQSVTEPTKTAEYLATAIKDLKDAGKLDKPVIASWMGGATVAEGYQHLNKNGIPTYALPDDAARIFCEVWSQAKHWHSCDQTVEVRKVSTEKFEKDNEGYDAIQLLQKAQAEGRDILSEDESKIVLKSFDVPVADTIVCTSAEETEKAGEQVKFPCVIKLHSKTITHKSDVGGVVLNVPDGAGAMKAFNDIKSNCAKHAGEEHFEGVTVQPMLDLQKGTELLLGCITDNQFGPMVVFGTGGCMVEVFKDTATAVPPLTPSGALALVDSTRISKALHGVGNARFPGVDMENLVTSVQKFSQMVCTIIPWVAELEINPLLAMADRCVALDARIVLRKAGTPVPSLSIRPYPKEYRFVLPNGDLIRPVQPKDAGMIKDFLVRLSKESAGERFSGMQMEEVSSDRNVSVLTNCDYSNQIGLIYVVYDKENAPTIAGVNRIFRLSNQDTVAEARFVVADAYQNRGIGRVLIETGEKVAMAEGIHRIDGAVRKTNLRAQQTLKKSGWYDNGELNEEYLRWSKLIGS